MQREPVYWFKSHTLSQHVVVCFRDLIKIILLIESQARHDKLSGCQIDLFYISDYILDKTTTWFLYVRFSSDVCLHSWHLCMNNFRSWLIATLTVCGCLSEESQQWKGMKEMQSKDVKDRICWICSCIKRRERFEIQFLRRFMTRWCECVPGEHLVER